MNNKTMTAGKTAMEQSVQVTETPKMAVLRLIAELQENTSPVKLSIGSVDNENHVMHDVIVIEECAPLVLLEVVKHMKESGRSHCVSMENGGLHISF